MGALGLETVPAKPGSANTFRVVNPRKAIRFLSELLKQEPDDLEARLLLADIYAGELEYDKAIHELEEALRINPGDKQILLKIAFLKVSSKAYAASRKPKRKKKAVKKPGK